METFNSSSFQNLFAHDPVGQENNVDHHLLPKCALYRHENIKRGNGKKHRRDHFATTCYRGAEFW
jgi:hypothetical protein